LYIILELAAVYGTCGYCELIYNLGYGMGTPDIAALIVLLETFAIWLHCLTEKVSVSVRSPSASTPRVCACAR
jgi:hypothetical protein